MGVDINKADVIELLGDKKLVNEVVKKIVEDPEVIGDLAGDIGEEIANYLEHDPKVRQKIINAALTSPDFKKRIVKEVVDELGD